MNVRSLVRALSFRWLVASSIGAGLFCSGASAVTLQFEANLDALQEVPPNGSPAFGLGDFNLDTTTSNITVTTGSYQVLLGNSTAVTLNDAALGFSGPIAITLTLDAPGATTGTFSGSGLLTPTQVADLEAGNFYVNIRSIVVPAGEIRGQLVAVPEPSTAALACVGLIGLVAASRKRK